MGSDKTAANAAAKPLTSQPNSKQAEQSATPAPKQMGDHADGSASPTVADASHRADKSDK